MLINTPNYSTLKSSVCWTSTHVQYGHVQVVMANMTTVIRRMKHVTRSNYVGDANGDTDGLPYSLTSRLTWRPVQLHVTTF